MVDSNSTPPPWLPAEPIDPQEHVWPLEAKAIRNQALEEAARVVERLGRDEHPEYYAAAIRALKARHDRHC